MRRLILVLAVLAVVAPAAARAVTVSYTMSGVQGANGWYTSPVTVRWVVSSDATSTNGCEPVVLLTKDTEGTKLTCTATAGADQDSRSTTVKIDQTPPTVTSAAAARPPDANGWYRSPVPIAWSGSDATSGVDSCTSVTFAGPDGPATLQGTCRDRAGNTSPATPFGLSYDATPPSLARVAAASGDAAATVGWRATGADVVTVMRSPGVHGAPASTVYSGLARRLVDTGLRNGVRYRYTVMAADAAGNAAVATASATPTSRLLGPAPGARLRHAPVLRWRRVARALYYNVQLYRGNRKVLSRWPSRSRLRLHGLRPGRYRWYVWPGYGARAAHRYGRLLGVRRFVVR